MRLLKSEYIVVRERTPNDHYLALVVYQLMWKLGRGWKGYDSAAHLRCVLGTHSNIEFT
jgi:hypothetical protein